MTAWQFVQPWLSELDGPQAMSAAEFANLRKYLKGLDDGTIPLFNLNALNATIVNLILGGNLDLQNLYSIINGVSIQAATLTSGKNGTSGTVEVYPAGSTVGKTTFTASNNSGNTTTNINTQTQTGARTYTIPDVGASADFIMGTGTQTIGGSKSFNAAVAMGSNKITGLAAGTAGTDAANFGQINVLQFVTATTTTSFSTTSATFQTSNLSASITPTSASNRVAIFTSATGATLNDNVTGLYALFRGTTNLVNATNGGAQIYGKTAIGTITTLQTPITQIFLDSPATTSSTTYSVKVACDGTHQAFYGVGETQVMILAEVV